MMYATKSAGYHIAKLVLFQNFRSIPLCVHMIQGYNVTSKGDEDRAWCQTAMRRNTSSMCHLEIYGTNGRVLAHGCHVATILSQMWLREAVWHVILIAVARGWNIRYLSRHSEKFWFEGRIVIGSETYVEATLWAVKVWLLQRMGSRLMKMHGIGYGTTIVMKITVKDTWHLQKNNYQRHVLAFHRVQLHIYRNLINVSDVGIFTHKYSHTLTRVPSLLSNSSIPSFHFNS